jgi:hypothetical protein
MGTFEYLQSRSGGAVKRRTAQMGTTGLFLAQPTAGSSYITLEELGQGSQHLTKCTIAGQPITLANTTGISFGSVPLLSFPKGVVHISAVSVDNFLFDYTDDAGNVTPIAGTHGGDFAIGSSATADGTLNGTEVNILASTSYDPFSTAVDANSAINAIIDGSSTAVTAYINAIVDDADVGDAASDVVEIGTTAAPVYIYLAWRMVR